MGCRSDTNNHTTPNNNQPTSNHQCEPAFDIDPRHHQRRPPPTSSTHITDTADRAATQTPDQTAVDIAHLALERMSPNTKPTPIGTRPSHPWNYSYIGGAVVS